MNMSGEYKCDVCATTGYHKNWGSVEGIDGASYDLLECPDCSFVHVWPIPTEKFIDDFYRNHYQGRVKTNINEKENPLKVNKSALEDCRKKIKYVERYATNLKKSNRVLDVGCGHGFFVHTSNQKGFLAEGVDIDQQAVEYGRKQLNLTIHSHSIESLDTLGKSTGQFDLITFWQVLEHLRLPGSTVRAAKSLLRPGGYIAGSVPNLGGIGAKIQGKKWYLMVPPEHLNYFNEQSFKAMLVTAGYQPIFVGTVKLYASPYFVIGIRKFVMNIAVRISNRLGKSILFGLHRLLTLMKRYLIYLPLNVLVMIFRLGGNSLFFVAQRQESN